MARRSRGVPRQQRRNRELDAMQCEADARMVDLQQEWLTDGDGWAPDDDDRYDVDDDGYEMYERRRGMGAYLQMSCSTCDSEAVCEIHGAPLCRACASDERAGADEDYFWRQ